MDPSDARCLGCLYIYPLDASLRRNGADEEALSQVGNDEAEVWFWVRPECVAADLDRRLLAAVIPWLRDDFAFSRVVVLTWSVDERQTTLLREAGLRSVWLLPSGDTHVLYFEVSRHRALNHSAKGENRHVAPSTARS